MALRILHTESSLGWGGQEIRVLSEARGVARRGHEVVLATPPEARIFTEAAKYGIETVALPIGKKKLKGLKAMRAFLGSRGFDVINTHSSTDSWLVAGACASRRAAPAIVRTRHISAALPDNATTRWLYRQARHIVTTGEKLRVQVIEQAGADAARVTSVPTGIDLERFKPGDKFSARREVGLPEEEFVVGIVATLRSWKGHRYLIDALATLDAKVTLAIVGDGPQREALGTLVADRGLAPRVTFAGNRDDVAPWLQAFDVFCLPSYANEGVPQALMQAMACGLPVVSTDVGSIGEIVADGETGILVKPQSEAAIATALKSLIDDLAQRERLGRAAAARAHERFGEALMVDRMIAIFEAA